MDLSDYLVIGKWMRTDLGLSGNELIAYAIIFSFSQDGKSEFTGSAKYIADWCGITKANALNLLKRLTEKGFIRKRVEIIDNVKYCRYSCYLPSEIEK